MFDDVNAWIYDHVQPSIDTLEKIKACVNSPICDVLTTLIPGNIDDAIAAWIKANVQKAIDALGISKEITGEKDFAKKLALLVEYLRILSPEERNGYYFRLASLTAQASGNAKTVKGNSVDLLVQMQYSKMVSGVTAAELPANPAPSAPVYNPLKREFE